MTGNKDNETLEGKPNKIEYEKPTVDTVSAHNEIYGVVANCSMGQTEPPGASEE